MSIICINFKTSPQYCKNKTWLAYSLKEYEVTPYQITFFISEWLFVPKKDPWKMPKPMLIMLYLPSELRNYFILSIWKWLMHGNFYSGVIPVIMVVSNVNNQKRILSQVWYFKLNFSSFRFHESKFTNWIIIQ